MSSLIFTVTLGVALFALLGWGFHYLPRERWQVLAILPGRRAEDGTWEGVNFTYYGLISASAHLFSVLIGLLLFGAAGIGTLEAALLIVALLVACLPASKLAAWIVERKSAGFSVAGAAFVGILLAPWMIVGIDAASALWHGTAVPVVPALAVMAIAYAYGEGLGRLGCISFGCCYGKALAAAPSWLRMLFRDFNFVFSGATKKIAYASHMEGEKVVPIQAVTAMLYIAAGLVATYLYLQNAYTAALLLALGVTQLWRAVSEVWRADYRGEGRVSVYQVLAVLGVLYSVAVLRFVPAQRLPEADLFAGFATLWHPGVLLFAFVAWIAAFIYYGRSFVLGARLSLHVCHDRI